MTAREELLLNRINCALWDIDGHWIVPARSPAEREQVGRFVRLSRGGRLVGAADLKALAKELGLVSP
jgi:hypothetical protein